MFELATNRIRLGGNRCSTFLLFTGMHILSDQTISPGYSQLDGVPGQVGGDAGEPLVGAVYGGAAAHAGLGAAAGPGHQHQHQQAAEAGLHGEASHRVTLAGVSSGHWSHGHGAGNGHHWCSHGVTRCRCPLSCFSPHGRLSTELVPGRGGGAGPGPVSAVPPPAQCPAGHRLMLGLDQAQQRSCRHATRYLVSSADLVTRVRRSQCIVLLCTVVCSVVLCCLMLSPPPDPSQVADLG